MPDSTAHNFSIESAAMGLIVIQPRALDSEELEKANLLIFPHLVDSTAFNVGVEWAAGTQTPIYCLTADVSRFEKEGFGSYRFHKLDGYREVDFQGGSVEYFPARTKRLKGVRGLTQEMGDWLGFGTSPGFHILIRPKGESSVLYLASNYVDQAEWTTLVSSNPAMIVGSTAHTKAEWHAFSTMVKRRVAPAAELRRIQTHLRSPGEANAEKRENPLWAVRTGSL